MTMINTLNIMKTWCEKHKIKSGVEHLLEHHHKKMMNINTMRAPSD
jgi:hypothetical protein